MKVCYLDGVSGISGDMCLGALLDAGLDISLLDKGLQGVPLYGYTLTARKVVKQGISATKADVAITGKDHHPRGLSEITDILQNSHIPEEVKEKAMLVFQKLVTAEAKVHGVPVEDAHLHEVGGIDAIVDIVGTVLGLHLMGISALYVSPLPLGGGTVKCHHGTLPVPAPATLELLSGMKVVPGPVQAELVTPTGAALVSALALSTVNAPPMEISSVGYGAGAKDFDHANVLRMIIGEVAEEQPEGYSRDTIAVVETTIDDMNPELFSSLGDKLFAGGALDYFLTPVYMKKGRPGTLLTALCPIGEEYKIAELILQETTSLGCRIRHESRCKAERQFITVTTPFGNIDVKYSPQTGTIAPEHSQCLEKASAFGVSAKAVYDAAKAEAWKALR